MGIVVQAGQRFAAIADMQVGDGNQGAAVGTTVALLERGSKLCLLFTKDVTAAMKNEFKLLSKIVSQYLPPEYPYDVVGGARNIKQTDFDDRIDVVPVADPNIFSMSQRITLAQTQLQIATSNPQLHNMYQIYRNMYNAIGVKDVDAVYHHRHQMHHGSKFRTHKCFGWKTFSSFSWSRSQSTHYSSLKFYVN